MKTKDYVQLAVIGGSGLYNLKGSRFIEELDLPTPFGMPSDLLSIVEAGGQRIAFLPRHGRGHRLLPSEVPVKANIWALKSLGVEQVLAVSAVGSLAEEYRPGDFVVCDQLIDRTFARPISFLGEGLVGHFGFADPYCAGMREEISRVLQKHGQPFHPRGTLVCMEGPIFSTRAESHLYRGWGAQLIGMTSLPEAKLAREAELCFALVAMVTDYDCWKPQEESVSLEMVLKVMESNTRAVQEVIPDIALALKKRKECTCRQAAKTALMTPPERIPYETRRRLALFYDKYWQQPR